jgi:hypothetical protein
MIRVLTILAALVVALGATAAPASALEPPAPGYVPFVPIPYPSTGWTEDKRSVVEKVDYLIIEMEKVLVTS